MNRWLLGVLSCGILFLSSCGGTGETPLVVIETSMGTIKAKLYQDQAPISVKNFLGYVDKKFYDDTIFHRVIEDFMIQGGGFTQDLKEKPTGPPITNEAGNGLSNKRGTIAMAREDQPDTASAQFYINVKDNPRLDRANARDKVGYCVFGKVIGGMDVVDRIRQVPTGKAKGLVIEGGKVVEQVLDDVPVQPVIIKSVRRAGGA